MALLVLCWGMGAAAQPSGSGQNEGELLNSARADLAKARSVLELKKLSLTREEQKQAETCLINVEQALASYEQLTARKATEDKTDMRVLLATAGATVVADDATGVGVADDVLLPFIALGLIAAQIEAMGPTPDQELQLARARLAMSTLLMSRMIMGARAAEE